MPVLAGGMGGNLVLDNSTGAAFKSRASSRVWYGIAVIGPQEQFALEHVIGPQEQFALEHVMAYTTVVVYGQHSAQTLPQGICDGSSPLNSVGS
jgi:hypothetical protein